MEELVRICATSRADLVLSYPTNGLVNDSEKNSGAHEKILSKEDRRLGSSIHSLHHGWLEGSGAQ